MEEEAGTLLIYNIRYLYVLPMRLMDNNNRLPIKTLGKKKKVYNKSNVLS